MSQNDQLSLKREYMQKKVEQEARELHEVRELLESYVLIAERLDTGTIARIVDAMTGIEKAIGPFLGKLPSLKVGLDAAEADLTNLISGKAGANSGKTGALLGKAMSFYQGVSQFLRQDLPVLLSTPTMAQAKGSPEAPVGIKMIPIFQQALAVHKDGGFLRKLFMSSNIPYVNNQALARELSSLTFAELTNLSNVGKMPVVVSAQQVDQVAQDVVGKSGTGVSPAPAVQGGQPAPATQATPGGQPTQASPAQVGPSPEKQKQISDYLRSTISGLMQGSPAATKVSDEVTKKVLQIVKAP